jgi:2-iminobutanoate/2-iminopropanoate deaminase
VTTYILAIACVVLAFTLGWSLARSRRPIRRFVPMTSAGDPGKWPFATAVEVGDTVYLAGHLGVTPPGGGTPDTPEIEAEKVMASVAGTLQKLRMTMDDLVYVQVFCPDVAHFKAFNQAYRQAFAKDLPARAFIGSGPLLFGARYEVQGIAIRR